MFWDIIITRSEVLQKLVSIFGKQNQNTVVQILERAVRNEISGPEGNIKHPFSIQTLTKSNIQLHIFRNSTTSQCQSTTGCTKSNPKTKFEACG